MSNQELERLHVRASRDVDFEYFFEGHCSDATRTRYQQLNKELHRRNHTANADPPTRQEPIARFPEANGTSRD